MFALGHHRGGGRISDGTPRSNVVQLSIGGYLPCEVAEVVFGPGTQLEQVLIPGGL